MSFSTATGFGGVMLSKILATQFYKIVWTQRRRLVFQLASPWQRGSLRTRRDHRRAERYFTAPYHRVLLDGVGHFPQRENPALISSILLEHLRKNASS